MLATKGVRALLVGSGFVEEKDALNAESADVATVQAGLEGLQALQVTRASQHGQSAPLAGHQLGFCASSGRAWWRWAACTARGRGQPIGRPATASGARASRHQIRPFPRL